MGKLLNGIIDKIQPTVKRDCNYYNVDRIKKQAVWDDEEEEWQLPGLRLERDSVSVPGNGQLTSRQTALLNRNSSVLSNTGYENSNINRNSFSRRLQPLRRLDNDDF